MAISEVYEGQLKIAREEFSEIVEDGQVLYSESGVPLKLRLAIIDSSIVDSFYSARGRYSYHWDRRAIDGSIYRYDNAPHRRWRHIRTFPKHFHSGSEADEACGESTISDDPLIAIREFLQFVREQLAREGELA